jgi:hypothetical protein
MLNKDGRKTAITILHSPVSNGNVTLLYAVYQYHSDINPVPNNKRLTKKNGPVQNTRPLNDNRLSLDFLK